MAYRFRMSIYNLLAWAVSVLMSLTIFFLGLRFLFRLFAANPGSPLVKWIYETSFVVLSPFIGIFPNSRLGNGSVFEFNTLFAIFMYMIIYALVLEVIDFFTRRILVEDDD